MIKNTFNNAHDINFYLPAIIPHEVNQYAVEIPQLGVGRAGKMGLLILALENNKDGKTVLVENYHKAPLQVQKALYIDETMPYIPYIYIMSPSGGILQGDRLRIDIHGRENAAFHVTTQAATKIYRMESDYATQILNITLDSGAYAEFWPDMIIPYKNSRFYQEVNLKIHEDATCLYSEILAPGRVAHGESFLYDIFYSKFQATGQSGRLRCLDHMVLSPKAFANRTNCILGDWKVLANFYLLTKKIESTVLCAGIEKAVHEDDICFASAVLPHDDGIIARVLGRSSASVMAACNQIWNNIRLRLTGKPAPNLRK